MDFKEELKKYQEMVNKELENYFKTYLIGSTTCYEKTLNDSKEYSLMAGGKRLRPILVLSTYKLFRDDIEKCFPYAIAIEMVHNFSLIHDDLPGIDNDDFRHGKLTNHKKFNEATAILAGDGLLNGAYMVISNDFMNLIAKKRKRTIDDIKVDVNDIDKKTRVFNEFSHAVDNMISGEYVDTEDEGKKIDIDELEYIHRNKTGALIELCVRMGAILGGATDEELKSLTFYAENIGLAFQIKDDILSEEGDEKVLGKPVGNDKKRGKCTYVSEYGLEEAKKILDRRTENAISALESFGDKAEFLRELALYIENRNK